MNRKNKTRDRHKNRSRTYNLKTAHNNEKKNLLKQPRHIYYVIFKNILYDFLVLMLYTESCARKSKPWLARRQNQKPHQPYSRPRLIFELFPRSVPLLDLLSFSFLFVLLLSFLSCLCFFLFSFFLLPRSLPPFPLCFHLCLFFLLPNERSSQSKRSAMTR